MSAPELVVITQSELGAFRSCEWKWSRAYLERLRPVRKARALTEGSAIHAGREAIYRQMQSWQRDGGTFDAGVLRLAAGQALEGYLTRVVERARTMSQFEGDDDAIEEESRAAMEKGLAALHTFIDVRAESDFREYRVLAVEHPFEIPVHNEHGNRRSRVILKGRIDLALQEWGTGTIVVNECKSTAGDAATADYRLDVDPQVRAYVYAARAIWGPKVTGDVHLDVLRKTAPSRPKVNLDGTVSVAACDTTREIYLAAREEQVTPKWLVSARDEVIEVESALARPDVPEKERGKLGAKLEKLRAKLAEQRARWKDLLEKQWLFAEGLPSTLDRWCARHDHHVSDAALDEWRVELHTTVREMRHVRAGRRLPVRNGHSCVLPWGGTCAYRTICVDDTPERREIDFEVIATPHPEVDEEEEPPVST